MGFAMFCVNLVWMPRWQKEKRLTKMKGMAMCTVQAEVRFEVEIPSWVIPGF